MFEFVKHGQLAARIGDTLFVHGGLISEDERPNLGVVPGRSDVLDDVDEWCVALNEWKSAQLRLYEQQPLPSPPASPRSYRGLIDYAVATSTVPSVVTSRHLDKDSMPRTLPVEMVRKLCKGGINRVVVGHTPHGHCPTVVSSDAGGEGYRIELIMADTSFSDFKKPDKRGAAVSTVTLRADGTTMVEGVLPDGQGIKYELAESRAAKGDQLIGRLGTSAASAVAQPSFVKAKLAQGDRYLLAHHKGFTVEYKELTAAETRRAVGDGAQMSGLV